MNDRIKDLALYAWRLTADETAYLNRIHNRTIEQDEITNIFEVKFAELIVRECINQVSDLMDYTEYTDSHFNAVELKALRDARRVIQEHFGVKE